MTVLSVHQRSEPSMAAVASSAASSAAGPASLAGHQQAMDVLLAALSGQRSAMLTVAVAAAKVAVKVATVTSSVSAVSSRAGAPLATRRGGHGHGHSHKVASVRAPLTAAEHTAALAAYRAMECNKLAHPWLQSCSDTWRGLFVMCFKAAGLRLYAPLFIIPALVRGKSIQHILTRTVPDVARSAFFIATFATSFCFYFCNFRHLLGFNTVLTNGIIPGFLASATSLPIEKKARRREIALYCSNHATSAVARLLVFHGWLPYVPYMDVATFTVAMSALMWTFRREPERLGSGVSALFGWMMDVRIPASPSDHPRSSQPAHNHQQPQQQGEQAQSSDRPSRPSRVKAILAKIQCPKPLLPTWRYIMGLLALKCPVCKHPGGCAHGALRAVLKGFALGFGLRGGVAFATSLAKYKLQLKKVLRAVFARPNLAFGGFLATLFGSARATECVLRLLRRKDDGINAVVAGAVSSLSILLARNEEISMYMLWKSFEALFNYGEARGMVPSWYHGDVLLFSVACSLLFHISVFEPHNLRRSYWNFLDKVSAGLWSHINRQAMDVLGFQSSALHPHDRV